MQRGRNLRLERRAGRSVHEINMTGPLEFGASRTCRSRAIGRRMCSFLRDFALGWRLLRTESYRRQE